MRLTIESNAYCSSSPKEQERHVVALSAEDDIEGWGAILLSIFVGRLALWFFLAMGGILALLGPWMIFVARHLVRQKWVRKVGRSLRQQAGELMEACRIYTATWKIHPRVE